MNYLIQFVLKNVKLLVGEGNRIHPVHLLSQQRPVHTGFQLPFLIECEVFIYHMGLLPRGAGLLYGGR